MKGSECYAFLQGLPSLLLYICVYSKKLTFLFVPSALRASPCLPERGTHPCPAGRERAQSYLWSRELLSSGCGHCVVRAGPQHIGSACRPSSPESTAKHPAFQPQTQPRHDILCVGLLLPPAFQQAFWQRIYLQRFPSVSQDAHQKTLHSKSWRWELCSAAGTAKYQMGAEVHIAHLFLFCFCLFLCRTIQLDVHPHC